jgi:hypothetical protein
MFLSVVFAALMLSSLLGAAGNVHGAWTVHAAEEKFFDRPYSPPGKKYEYSQSIHGKAKGGEPRAQLVQPLRKMTQSRQVGMNVLRTTRLPTMVSPTHRRN